MEKATSTIAKLTADLQHHATSGRVVMSDQATALASVDFDKARFAATLKTRALPPYGSGQCAKYVRIALEAAGMATGPNPRLAKDYGPYLEARGFTAVARFVSGDAVSKGVDSAGFKLEVGDVAVIQNPSSSTAGHIQGYDGANWISDFVQDAFWPGPAYRSEKPSYVIYRR
jgi:hypothetical protein